MFAELGYDLDHDGITAWLESDYDVSGAQLYTDTEICELASKEDTCTPEVEEDEEMDAEEEKCTVSHSNATFMFEQCLTWLEHQPEAKINNTMLLRELHSLAAVNQHYNIFQSKLIIYDFYSFFFLGFHCFVHQPA